MLACCVSPSLKHTLKIITMRDPPFRHQTNALYVPATTLTYVDPGGDLPHDKVFSAALSLLKLFPLQEEARELHPGPEVDVVGVMDACGFS